MIIKETQKHHYLKSVQSTVYREQQTMWILHNEKIQKAWYIPVQSMHQAEFQLAKANSTVQIKAMWGKTGLYTKWMIPF